VYAELRDIVDHRHALESNRLEVGSEVLGPAHFSFPKLESGVRERAWQLGFLEERARSREKNSDLAAPDTFEGLHALTCYFGMRLDFPKTFPRRVERNEPRVVE
jgi:hypothetical protein